MRDIKRHEYKYQRLLKIDNRVVKKTEDKSYTVSTARWILPRDIYFAVIRDFDDCSSEMIAEVHSSHVPVYLRNREAYRGYKYSIRGSNLGGSCEKQPVCPLLFPWKGIRRAKRYLHDTYDTNTPNMRAACMWWSAGWRHTGQFISE